MSNILVNTNNISNNMSTDSTNIVKNDKENIYFNTILTKKICMKSKFLNEKIDEYIYDYIKDKVEGVCIDEGYVKPDSVKILKKSVGMLLGSKFTGDITYTVAYTAQLCNPVIGNIIDCKVKFINKLGILGNNGPISIIVGKQLHKNEDFEFVKPNDIIKVEVIAKKFSLNDKEIKIVAKLWKENSKNNDIEILVTKKNKKKDELMSSDLTPIIFDNEYQDEDVENTSINSDDNENEINEETSLMEEEDEDDDFIDSENEDEIEEFKLENPDEANIDVDDIDVDEKEDDDETEEGDISDVDYE